MGIYHLRFDLRSYSMLVHLLDPAASGPILRWETNAADVEDMTFPVGSGSVRARLYIPRGIAHPPGMVIFHGVHRLGIDEPRLVRLARAAAGSGFTVLTPELAGLADYRVDEDSLRIIGESPAWLQRRLAGGPVTVVSVSFAGGLSLLAACGSQNAQHVRALVLIGAYDDLSRVSRFLATSEAEFPDGRKERYKAHDYGVAVFAYSHLEQFFAAGDQAIAHEALRDWLWERPNDAEALLPRFSPEGRATMELVLAHQVERLRPRLLDAITQDEAQLKNLSPEGHLKGLRVPVYILHGATDDIIPSSESRWLAEEIPQKYLRAVLITPAFSHVDADPGAAVIEKLRLVNFLADVLRASN